MDEARPPEDDGSRRDLLDLWFSHLVAAAGALLAPLPFSLFLGDAAPWRTTAAGTLASVLNTLPEGLALAAVAMAIPAGVVGVAFERITGISRQLFWGIAGALLGALFGASQGHLGVGLTLCIAGAAGGSVAARATQKPLGRLIAVAALLVISLLPTLIQHDDSTKPKRLILITVDTLRADHLSSYGYSRVTSPHLDELVDTEATLFRNAYASSSWTLPSVTSFLTSLYPPQHKVVDDSLHLSPRVPTLAAALEQEGWLTAAIVSHLYASSRFGLNSGFLEFDEILPGPDSAESYFDAGVILAKARRWIAFHSDEQFFLYIHLFDPHFDYAPPSPFDRTFVDPSYDGKADGSWEYVGRYSAADQRLEEKDLAQVVALYDGEIRFVDEQLGDFFTFLKDAGLWEDTALVFSADHGEEFQEHGSVHHSRTLFEEVLRVPLIVKRAFGRTPAQRKLVEERVRTIDVAPTLLDLAAVESPPSFEGSSLLPLLEREGDDRSILAHTHRYSVSKAALIVGDEKLILDLPGDPVRFDLSSDPRELQPLRGGISPLQERLTSELHRMLAFQTDPGQVALTDEERQRLEALGYVE